MIKGSQISEILLRRGGKICTSADIRDIAKEKYIYEIGRLTGSRWIVPIKGFKGVYYVQEPDERERGFYKIRGFPVLLGVFNAVFGRDWYFGGVSALSLLGLTHQPLSVNYVFNSKYSKTIESAFFGKVVLVKTSASMGRMCGIVTKEYLGTPYRVSGLERNLADYLYLHVHGHASREHISKLYINHKSSIDRDSVVEIIFRCYPKKSAMKMMSVLRGVAK